MSTGYLRSQTNHRNNTAQISQMGRMTPQETGWHIEAVISKIYAGHYKHYARGGFSRREKRVLTGLQVAQRCGVYGDDCLLEVKDSRVEHAVMECGLNIVTPATYMKPKAQPEIRAWRQAIVY